MALGRECDRFGARCWWADLGGGSGESGRPGESSNMVAAAAAVQFMGMFIFGVSVRYSSRRSVSGSIIPAGVARLAHSPPSPPSVQLHCVGGRSGLEKASDSSAGDGIDGMVIGLINSFRV